MTYSDKEIEVILQNYNSLLASLKMAEEVVMHPYKFQDDNIGGGKSNMTSDPTSQLAASLIEAGNKDVEKHVRAIQLTYSNVNVDQKKMMKQYYFDREFGVNDKTIAARLRIDRTHLWRQRKSVCKEMRKQLGI